MRGERMFQIERLVRCDRVNVLGSYKQFIAFFKNDMYIYMFIYRSVWIELRGVLGEGCRSWLQDEICWLYQDYLKFFFLERVLGFKCYILRNLYKNMVIIKRIL